MYDVGPIYTTKIDTFVCPPHISETVAVWIMKLAHRPRIASTTITLISKSILLFFLSILFKQFSQSALARIPTQTHACRVNVPSPWQLAPDHAPSSFTGALWKIVDNWHCLQTTLTETGCFLFWQLSKVQRFNLLTIKGWNSAQRRQYLSKEEWYRAYATDVSTYYGACKKSNTLCIICCRSRNRTIGVTVFSESDSVSLCQSQLRLTHSVRALFAYIPGTGNCNFTLPCVKESC